MRRGKRAPPRGRQADEGERRRPSVAGDARVKNGGSENEVGSTENIHSCEREVRDARGMRAPSKSKERREGGRRRRRRRGRKPAQGKPGEIALWRVYRGKIAAGGIRRFPVDCRTSTSRSIDGKHLVKPRPTSRLPVAVNSSTAVQREVTRELDFACALSSGDSPACAREFFSLSRLRAHTRLFTLLLLLLLLLVPLSFSLSVSLSLFLSFSVSFADS